MSNESERPEWIIPPNHEAKLLVKNEKVYELFGTLVSAYFEEGAACDVDDDLGRLRAVTKVNGLRELWKQLEKLAAGKPSNKKALAGRI